MFHITSRLPKSFPLRAFPPRWSSLRRECQSTNTSGFLVSGGKAVSTGRLAWLGGVGCCCWAGGASGCRCCCCAGCVCAGCWCVCAGCVCTAGCIAVRIAASTAAAAKNSSGRAGTRRCRFRAAHSKAGNGRWSGRRLQASVQCVQQCPLRRGRSPPYPEMLLMWPRLPRQQ